MSNKNPRLLRDFLFLLVCHPVGIPFKFILRDINSFFLISGRKRDSSVSLRNDKGK